MEFLSKQECEIILAFADNNMVVEPAARAVGIKWGDLLRERLRQIKMRTGLDPYKFYDLYELTKSAKHWLELY